MLNLLASFLANDQPTEFGPVIWALVVAVLVVLLILLIKKL